MHTAGNSTAAKSPQQEMNSLFSDEKRSRWAEMDLLTPCATAPSTQQIQTCWCPIAHKPETKLRSVERLERKVIPCVAKRPTNVLYGIWTLHQTLLTGGRAPRALHCLPQDLPCLGEKSEDLAMVPPPSHTLALPHPESWQQETSVSFPAVSWTSLTPCLQILMMMLPKPFWRQWISPWEDLESFWMSFRRQTERSCTCSTWLHHLLYDLLKSCTCFQGRLHASQSKYPKSQFSSWCLRVTV